MDLSTFQNNGATISQDVVGSFLSEDFDSKSVPVRYVYNDEEYPGRMDKDKYGRHRIFWRVGLQRCISNLFDFEEIQKTGEYPYMIFRRIGELCYEVNFVWNIGGPRIVLSDLECSIDADILDRILSINDDREMEVFIGEASFEDAMPVERKMIIAKAMVRNPVIADYVKRRDGYRCQICGAEGFLKPDGSRYAEAHHLMELGKQKDGERFEHESLMICVCPTCHRVLHYGARSELLNRLALRHK